MISRIYDFKESSSVLQQDRLIEWKFIKFLIVISPENILSLHDFNSRQLQASLSFVFSM